MQKITNVFVLRDRQKSTHLRLIRGTDICHIFS